METAITDIRKQSFVSFSSSTPAEFHKDDPVRWLYRKIVITFMNFINLSYMKMKDLLFWVVIFWIVIFGN